MILNKNNFSNTCFFKFSIILFGNIINGFSGFQWPSYTLLYIETLFAAKSCVTRSNHFIERWRIVRLIDESSQWHGSRVAIFLLRTSRRVNGWSERGVQSPLSRSWLTEWPRGATFPRSSVPINTDRAHEHT